MRDVSVTAKRLSSPRQYFRVLFFILFTGHATTGVADAQSPLRLVPGASGAISGTRLDPAPGGSGRTELQFEQPLLFLSGRALGEHLHFSAALSLDKLATPDGVMSFGASGGGFYDRQHPHDYIHEAVVSLVGDIGGPSVRRGQISLSGGKGIVPFGSDPPHMRPALHAPMNHHWSLWNLSGTFDLDGAAGRATVLTEVGKAATGSEYWTALAESQWAWRENRVYYRVERTDRPEAPRAADPFRSTLEPIDPARVGASRWFIHTLGYGLTRSYGIVSLEPVVELAFASATTIDAGAVDVKRLYGQTTMWSGVLAVKLSIGTHHSTGQYGALAPAQHHGAHRQ